MEYNCGECSKVYNCPIGYNTTFGDTSNCEDNMSKLVRGISTLIEILQSTPEGRKILSGDEEVVCEIE